MAETGRQRKAKSQKYKLFEEPVYEGILKDIVTYENVTQCLDEVSSLGYITFLELSV